MMNNSTEKIASSFATQWSQKTAEFAPQVVLRYREPLLSWITDKHLALALPVVVYWVLSAFFMALDYLQLCERHRIHSVEELNKNIVSVGQVLWAVFLQHSIQTGAGIALEQFEEPDVTGHEPYVIWKIGRNLGVSPFAAWVLFRFVFPLFRLGVAIFIIDTWQYMLHRFMHTNKWAYRTMHSVHHRLYVPYAFGALYNSLAEGFLLDTLGTGIASLAVGLTDRENMILFVFSTIKTVDDHCGYELPWDPMQFMFPNRSTYHDIHHQQFGIKTNFSQPFFIHWDTMLGTKYVRTEEYIAENKRIREELARKKLKQE